MEGDGGIGKLIHRFDTNDQTVNPGGRQRKSSRRGKTSRFFRERSDLLHGRNQLEMS